MITCRTSRAALLAAVVLAAAGCSRKTEHGGFAMPPTPVESATVTTSTVVDRFDAVGTIEAGDAITVVSEISAVVTDLPFHEGAAVSKGDLIARLDDDQLRAEVARAEAIRDQNRSAFERVRSVVDAGAGAAQDLDDASAALRVSEADLALSEARLAKTRITAPFDGVVGVRRVSSGAFLRPGDAVTDLAMIRELRVIFAAPERYLGKLRKGSEITVSTTAYPGLPIQGTIDFVEPIVDAATRSATVVARVTNPEGKLRPGMSADVSAILASREDALTIPSEAVFVEGNQAFVYVIGGEGVVHRTAITLGTRLADAVEVLGGLAAGDQVVKAGHQKLYEGAKVAAGGAAPPGAGAAPDEKPAAEAAR